MGARSAVYDEHICVLYRLNDPTATTLIFDSGKAVCTGATTVDAVHKSLSIVVEDLRELGIDSSLITNHILLWGRI
jgi:TATA-box binding protein (TBP) (component of TFIID and TFIIIB)